MLETYLRTVPAEFHVLIRALDALIRSACPGLGASLKWGNLTYHHEHNVCSLLTHKEHVNLQFFRGASLPDPNGLLQGTGKRMRHVTLHPGDTILTEPIATLVRAAASAPHH